MNRFSLPLRRMPNRPACIHNNNGRFAQARLAPRIFASVCLLAFAGGTQLRAQVSVAESPGFVLDLRPPVPVSVAESAWFTLDLYVGRSFADSPAFALNLAPPMDPAYVAWLENYFSPADVPNPRFTAFDIDADFDGYSNWYEYVTQLDPTDRESRFRVYYTSRARLAFRVGPVVEGIEYDLQYSEDLETWTTFDEARVSVVGDELEVDLSDLSSELFHRVLITNPELIE